MRWSAVAGVALLGALLCPAHAPAADEPAPTPRSQGDPVAVDDERDSSLAVILERAGAYATRYGESFRNLVAEESYRQAEAEPGAGLVPRRVRNLRSDVVFVRWAARSRGPHSGMSTRWTARRCAIAPAGWSGSSRAPPHPPASRPWPSFRRARAQPGSGRDAPQRQRADIALLFLLPEHHARLAFKRKGRKTIAGFRTVEVAFEELARPTIVRDRWNEDVPARGSFWVDPVRGTVLRARIEYDMERQKRLLDRSCGRSPWS